ncbi:MAG: DUF362 domain-containing protein [Anaerolineae bacterium]|nr:DUF362 domain-containing protein [Anaerolineae bacterium]
MSRTQCGGRHISRRQFLRGAGLAAAGALVAGCRTQATAPSAQDALATVAIAAAQDYRRETIRARVRDLLDGIGGLGDVVHAGDRVAIKVNLTGGTSAKPLHGYAPVESYITHPEVVRALGEFVRDAGAREVLIVEAVYEWASYVEWGYEEVADAIGAQLIDLNATEPYSDYAQVAVGEGAFIYQDFTFNHVLEDVDVFMSVAKMKNHYNAGVTHTMKNLIGLVPAQFYRMDPRHNHRSALHGEANVTPTRLPRVIVDLNRARPIHLGLIDGIKTTQGGEGPWIGTMSAIAPGVLLAGKDVVATDAVATAAQGYDPTIERPKPPFLRGDNHLNLARELGLGTNRLDEIHVVGPSIDDVRIPFEPCWD